MALPRELHVCSVERALKKPCTSQVYGAVEELLAEAVLQRNIWVALKKKTHFLVADTAAVFFSILYPGRPTSKLVSHF